MKKMLLILLFLPALCFSQARAVSIASTAIINAAGTAQYRIDQQNAPEEQQNLS